MRIRHLDSDDQGEFQAVKDGFIVGEMNYYWADDNTMVISSTKVRPEYENQGIGKQLVGASVNFARKKGLKIYPQCAFARATFDRHFEYNDVRKV